MNTLSDLDLGWLSGMLDGEGYIGSKPNGKYRVVQVVVTSTDFDYLERLMRITGIGNIHNKPDNRPRTKQAWTWTVAAREDVRDLLMAVLPYLGKRRRAKSLEVLQLIEERRKQLATQLTPTAPGDGA